MGRLITSSTPSERMIESPLYSRILKPNQYIETTRHDNEPRRMPSMWTELIAGALAMLALITLMYLVFSDI
jgi:hypothetical protein